MSAQTGAQDISEPGSSSSDECSDAEDLVSEAPIAEMVVEGSAAVDSPGGDAARESGDQLSRLVDNVAELTVQVRRAHDRAAKRESILAVLADEVDVLRRGERRALLRPMITSIARVRDSLLQQSASLPEDFDAARAVRLLESFAGEIELLLEDNGVSLDWTEPGSTFDARRHRLIRMIDTADETLVGQVAETHRAAYVDDETGAILSHGGVSVYRLAPGSVEPNGTGNHPDAEDETTPTNGMN